ncbi:MAG: hydroxymethylglutaryl-CoA lyase [Gammaproteobacteria bacterium]|nr:hydroxymethylglutaryl-CoA lyase [Gammaproteobacteria bacterium]MDH4310948.1 hydroxymethylglutaryl-CoA lyase [Gammaproteobacteria bacterium]MDH5272802.1 hydroxymethylglutaryl-CoA lyase [Gammaproteobacteria bacterium]
MSTHVDVVEVGPRDGLQSEPGVFPTAAKIEFIRRALAAGLRRVEVASFVNPKKVPQMADAEAVLQALGAPPSGAHFIGLVLNRKGYERAVAAGCNEIGMAVVASDTFNRRNQGVSTDESIAAWLDIARAAEQAGVRAQVTVSAAFGCPFEGEIAVARVVEVARRVAEARPFEIALADTIGVGVPTQVTEIVSRVREAVPGIPLRCHFHNTRNTGFANAFAALQAGVRTLDASLGGIGGCPFAPAATGNIATEDLLYQLHRAGYTTGVSLDAAIETGKWLQEQLGRSVPGMLVKAGGFPRPSTAAA